MKEEEFLTLVNNQFKYRLEILSNPLKRRKGGSEDRLIQFKRMAKMRKVSSAQTAIDLCCKQFTDIIDMVDGSHEKAGDLAYFRELIADVQNYLDLAHALKQDEEKSYKVDSVFNPDDTNKIWPGRVTVRNTSISDAHNINYGSDVKPSKKGG